MVLFKIDYLGNANVSFVGADASKLIFELDNMGICVSSGSACSSGNTTPSHVLSAINTPKLYINSAIRSTFSDFNTFEEIAQRAVDIAEENDLIITLGCGDIYKAANIMVKECKEKNKNEQN